LKVGEEMAEEKIRGIKVEFISDTKKVMDDLEEIKIKLLEIEEIKNRIFGGEISNEKLFAKINIGRAQDF
jgi:hypothetical protein